MESTSASESTIDLTELLDRVERGESVIITRQGKPIAQLMPTTLVPKRERNEVVRDMLEFGKGRKLKGMSIQKMIDEGRRF